MIKQKQRTIFGIRHTTALQLSNVDFHGKCSFTVVTEKTNKNKDIDVICQKATKKMAGFKL